MRAHARVVLAPVLPIARLAAALELSEPRVRDLIDRLEIPHLDAEGIVLVDAGIGERAVRRSFGAEAGDAVHRARGGDPARPAAALRTDEQPTAPALKLDWGNIEEVLRAALAQYGGLLSYPLYRIWCVAHGQPPWSIRRINNALGVDTWTDALVRCGGRRGVTTPADRADALALLASAATAHGGHVTMDDHRDWARMRGARWLDPAKVAGAAGYDSWNEALAAAKAENSAHHDGGGRGSEMRHDVA